MALLLLCLPISCTAVAKKLPHILFIVADDFGYNDVGYHQSTESVPRAYPANPSGRPTTDAAAG